MYGVVDINVFEPITLQSLANRLFRSIGMIHECNDLFKGELGPIFLFNVVAVGNMAVFRLVDVRSKLFLAFAVGSISLVGGTAGTAGLDNRYTSFQVVNDVAGRHELLLLPGFGNRVYGTRLFF